MPDSKPKPSITATCQTFLTFLPAIFLTLLFMRPRFLFCVMVLLMAGCKTPHSEEPAEHADSLRVDSLAQDSIPKPDSRPSIVRTDSTHTHAAYSQYIEGAFTVPAAMEVIYGLYDRNIECAKWVCKPQEARRFESKASQDGTLHTRAAGVYPIETPQSKKMLLLTETLSREKEGWEDCHACAPILGAAMFQEIDGAWFIEALQKDLGELGSWGQLPANRLTKLGPDLYGVLFNYGYTAQGVSQGGIHVMGLVQGQFHALLDVNTSYSNEGTFADPKVELHAYSYDSDISFEATLPDAPYLLTIIRQGRRPKDGMEGDGPVQNFSETLRYRLDGTRYVLVADGE